MSLEKILKERCNDIQSWIDARVKAEETTMCLFCIKVPANEDVKAIVTNILEKNSVKYSICDTIPGSWNLNDDYYECEPIECIVEYCGVYPVHWDINDVAYLEMLCNTDKIFINVHWVSHEENGDIKYTPNH